MLLSSFVRRKKRLNPFYAGIAALICLLLIAVGTTHAFSSLALPQEAHASNPVEELNEIQEATLDELRLLAPDNKLGRHNRYSYDADTLAKDIERGWKLILVVNRSESPTIGQTVTIYLNGQLHKFWPVSTALEGIKTRPNGTKMFATTFTGRFTIEDMHRDYFSRSWQEPLKYMIFYGPRQYGIAFHATPDRKADKKIGRRDSAGCVRLRDKNAAELFDLVKQYKRQTLVIIHESSTKNPNGVPRKTDLSML